MLNSSYGKTIEGDHDIDTEILNELDINKLFDKYD
jgi:hypothetical protein